MAIFNGRRLTAAAMGLPVERLRRGDYSDKYFDNVVRVLTGLSASGYRFAGQSPRALPSDPAGYSVGDALVEAQIFTRRGPFALVGGVDAALAMLRHASGYFAEGVFHEAWRDLEVEAVEDGALIPYDGHPENVRPVIRVRGRYCDFAALETAMLGALTRVSRTATNTYEVAQAANGKPVLFFPARFDLPEVQAADGYGYWLGIQRYNRDTGQKLTPLVSTDAGAAWWGGRGGGTIPHALIACFLGDTAEAMVAFARHIPPETPRIVLADFNNDSVGATLATLDAYWPGYRAALLANDAEALRRWTLNGVRLDTSANLTDIALGPDGEPGVSAALVRAVRAAIDNAHLRWGETGGLAEAARDYCARVQIVVSGGFNRERIEHFERDNVPVDVYGVGSTFLRNDRATNTDFTMDLVRVQMDGAWVDVAKVGRRTGDNPDLRPIDLSLF
jgi:nicotinate phosphoribosyltransferase